MKAPDAKRKVVYRTEVGSGTVVAMEEAKSVDHMHGYKRYKPPVGLSSLMSSPYGTKDEGRYDSIPLLGGV